VSREAAKVESRSGRVPCDVIEGAWGDGLLRDWIGDEGEGGMEMPALSGTQRRWWIPIGRTSYLGTFEALRNPEIPSEILCRL
jgi:hypothetical protein